jgi:hypothetical protein
VGKKRGHFQAFIEAEDGSVLRVIGTRAKQRPIVISPDIARKVRIAATARLERDEAREWAREARELRAR